MKTTRYTLGIVAIVSSILLLSAFGISDKNASTDKALHQTISELDSIFFTAYNNCDLKTQADMLSEDLEFYHDQGGLNTSKTAVMAAIEENICNKVTRELVAGSIEVSPIPGFGAVQLGMHKFHNSQEPNAVSKPSRFVALWKQTGESWQMTRIISLHSN